jgi:hypothetical protein
VHIETPGVAARSTRVGRAESCRGSQRDPQLWRPSRGGPGALVFARSGVSPGTTLIVPRVAGCGHHRGGTDTADAPIAECVSCPPRPHGSH